MLQRQLTETETLKREAERAVIAAEAEAKAVSLAGLAEAEVMRAKGYNERDVLQAEVQKAYAAGIGAMGSGGASSSGGGGGITGDVMGMGVGLAMAGAMAPQISNFMQGMNPQGNAWQQSAAAPPPPPSDAWDCLCGQRGNTGNFCSNCGRRRGDENEA